MNFWIKEVEYIVFINIVVLVNVLEGVDLIFLQFIVFFYSMDSMLFFGEGGLKRIYFIVLGILGGIWVGVGKIG